MKYLLLFLLMFEWCQAFEKDQIVHDSVFATVEERPNPFVHREIEVERYNGTKFLWGALGGLVGGISGFFIGGLTSQKDGFGPLMDALVGGVLGGGIGSGAGVYFTGSYYGQEGSLAWTFLGSMVGFAVGFPLTPYSLGLIPISMGSLGGLLAYNLSDTSIRVGGIQRSSFGENAAFRYELISLYGHF